MLSSLLFISGCSSKVPLEVEIPPTEYVVFIPKKVPVPEIPVLEQYDPAFGMDHPDNFTKFQKNTVKLVAYIKSLLATIRMYESQIDRLEEQRKTLEESTAQQNTTIKQIQ